VDFFSSFFSPCASVDSPIELPSLIPSNAALGGKKLFIKMDLEGFNLEYPKQKLKKKVNIFLD
jgi:thiol-disulfide isomerase/thioredoxin